MSHWNDSHGCVSWYLRAVVCMLVSPRVPSAGPEPDPIYSACCASFSGPTVSCPFVTQIMYRPRVRVNDRDYALGVREKDRGVVRF